MAERACCPTCGSVLGSIVPADVVRGLHLTPHERTVAEILVRNFGSDVPAERLVAAMYDERPDGGALGSGGVLNAVTFRLRRKLKPYGLTVKGWKGAGGAACMKWLLTTDKQDV